MIEEPDWPVHDLQWVVRLGRERLADVLEADEHRVCDLLEGLSGDAGHLFARLIFRKPTVFFVPELNLPLAVEPAVEALVGAGLAVTDVGWSDRLDAVTVPVLTRWCRVRGLTVGGRRADKVQRLREVAPVDPRGAWVRPLHRPLVRLLEQAAFMDKRADARQLVVERLGRITWPAYTPTGGPVLFRDVDHRRAWQATWAALSDGSLTVEQALQAFTTRADQTVGRMSLTRGLTRFVLAEVDQLRRQDPAAALDLLTALRRAAGLGEAQVVLEESRIWEAMGQPIQAYEALAAARSAARGPDRLALHRSGRRLGAALRRGWAPDPPLATARTRSLRLEPVGTDGPRPRWKAGDGEAHVEQAVAVRLAELGRRAVRAEGGLIRTLYALLFAEAAFLPVPGALPVPHLDGPLDLGTPAFAERRRSAVDAVLDRIDAGEGPELIASACARWHGVRLAGVSRDLSDPEPWVRVACALGPVGLRAVLDPLLERGWGAARGLPDLLLLDGPPVRLEHGHPKRIGPDACWIEVKGPGDTLRDGQRLWIDHLTRRGCGVEQWSVSPRD